MASKKVQITIENDPSEKNDSCGLHNYFENFYRCCSTLIALSMVLFISSCVSTSRNNAKQLIKLIKAKQPSVGEISEQIIDLNESGYYIIKENIKSLVNPVTQDIKSSQFTGLVFNAIHSKMFTKLGKISDPDNCLRKSLIEKYGDFSKNVYDEPKIAFYCWLCERANYPQTLIFLDPKIFKRNRIEEVTIGDMKKYFDEVALLKTFKVKLKYLGTADCTFPTCIGKVTYFDMVSMEPLKK